MRLFRLSSILALVTIPIVLPGQVRSGSTQNEPPGIHREVLFEEQTAQALRVTYQPGTVEAAGTHPFDVILVPLNRGTIKLNVPGKPDPAWQPGSAIFIKRGTEHRLANVGEAPIEFVAIRIP